MKIPGTDGCRPPERFAVMLDVVKYCKSRLSGTAIDKNGHILNEEKVRENLKAIIEIT